MAEPAENPADSQAAPQPDFATIAAELNLLTPEQLARLQAQRQHYASLGIPMREDEICIELNLLDLARCTQVLTELHRRRKLLRKAQRKDKPEARLPETIKAGRLGQYELLKRLGGLMGVVYKAYDHDLQRPVALKLLPRLTTGDPRVAERFQREARAAGRLSHPNIVGFLGAGEIERRLYICFEFVEGETLGEKLKRLKRLPETETLLCLRDVCLALEHAHAHDLVHRDIKPDNIIVDLQGRPRLADLGLVKIVCDDQQLTASGIAVGTPYYISPEQARGEKSIDGRSDLYGLGAMLFHLLCGQPPFLGSAAEVMRQHVFSAPPDPRHLRPDLKEATRDLILKLMSKEPGQRVQTAREVIAELDAILGPDFGSPPPPPDLHGRARAQSKKFE